MAYKARGSDWSWTVYKSGH